MTACPKVLVHQDGPTVALASDGPIVLVHTELTTAALIDAGPTMVVGDSNDEILVLREGDPGQDGQDGEDGDDGADGASAYQIAVADGFVGDVSAWLASLVGAAGEDGSDGADGADGIDGEDGADGTSAYELAVAEGFVGDLAAWLASLVGAAGEDGSNGINGTNGTNGTNGADGSVWRTGSGVPSNGTGVNGDYYLNTANGDVYLRAGGTYSVVANIKGPTGTNGTNGTNGSNGTNGKDGLAQCGRLTLTTAVPVTTSDVTGASTVYWTPWRGNTLSIFDGTTWQPYNESELSIALAGLTSGKNYDVFAYRTSSTPANDHRSFTTNYAGSGSTLTIDKPAGTVAGDIIVVAVRVYHNSVASATSGWTMVTGPTVTVSTFNARNYIFWKRAGSSEPSTYALNVAGEKFAVVECWKGSSTTVDPVFAGSTGASLTCPSVTTPGANSQLFLMTIGYDNVTTYPGSTTTIAGASYSGSSADYYYKTCKKAAPTGSGAASGTNAFSGGGGSWTSTWTVAFAPEPAGADITRIDLGPAWTNDTTRASAVSLTGGQYVNTAQLTSLVNSDTVAANRGLLLGTIRATGTNTTEDSVSKGFVANIIHPVPKRLRVADTTIHTYDTATTRPYRNLTSNRVEWVTPIAERAIVGYLTTAFQHSNSGAAVYVGIGLDSTTVINTTARIAWYGSPLPELGGHTVHVLAAGYHYFQLLQQGSGNATNSYYGTTLEAEVWL